MPVAVEAHSPPSSSVPASPPSSSATFGHPTDPYDRDTSRSLNGLSTHPVPNGNPSSLRSHRLSKPPQNNGQDVDDAAWGSNFWVTLVDPQTQVAFFACPATGQVSWDPPVGNFVLPPNEDGEWWELSDESRGGLPYYYQTKTGETVWERPEGFVIPLGIIQNTALGRRLSITFNSPATFDANGPKSPTASVTPDRSVNRRAPAQETLQLRRLPSSTPVTPIKPGQPSPTSAKKRPPSPGGVRRSVSTEPYNSLPQGPARTWASGQQLPPIPGSPYRTDTSAPSTPGSRKSSGPQPNGKTSYQLSTPERPPSRGNAETGPPPRTRAKSSPHRPPQPQSLGAAVELLASSQHSQRSAASESGHGSEGSHSAHSVSVPKSILYGRDNRNSVPNTPITEKGTGKRYVPASPRRPIPATPPGGHFWNMRNVSLPSLAGKEISSPTLNHQATLNMSPVKNRGGGRPIPVEARPSPVARPSIASSRTGHSYPILPEALASDIQQFVESDYARQYFSTHRTGFIFRRRVPVAQMMAWQKAPLTSPLLTLNRSLNKDAVKIFKVIQRIMGDRERDRPVGVRVQQDPNHSVVPSIVDGSTTSLVPNWNGVLEEERWLLGEGLTHGGLRDEIYCQVMKQLNGNPSSESVFKGWQLLCVLLITFPPSKDFETYLHSFIQQRTTQQEYRVDIMAKHCIRRLAGISKKGPRGRPPTTSEIETASDAAFNPSTFGESLDATIRLQERSYPHQKVPIVLPFLADGILALGGTKAEGIFRVPGDGDNISDLKVRIDRGYYTLDGVDDPHVLASLLKLWLRELCDPLIPEEMYNECITQSKDPQACVRIVERLPTINRRVVLFIVSFLQLFLEDRIQTITKMTPANLALVMAPNLLRCNSESMTVVFTNAQFEQIFVYNLLLHLKCNEVDKDYVPGHGLGAVSTSPLPRNSKSRSRRPHL